MRRLISMLLSVVLLSGCFRYQYSSSSMSQLETLNRLDQQQDRSELCKFALSAKHAPAPVELVAGECLEHDSVLQKQYGKGWFRYYESAARCGSDRALEYLRRSGSELPSRRYVEGETGIMLFDDRVAACGFDREVTAWGWVAAPVGVPLYIVGACATIAVIIPVMALAVLMGGAN